MSEKKAWWDLPPTQKQLDYIEMNIDHIDMNKIKTRKQASDAISKGEPLFVDRDNWGD